MFLKLKKIIALLIIISFSLQQVGFAQLNPVYFTPPSFLTPDKFRPLHLRYLEFNPQNNNFQLLIDKGDAKNLNQAALTGSTRKLMDYFLIGLTLPNSSFWVNLRPDEGANIIDPELEKTDIGKILLEADLNLKKDLALATSPKTAEGRQYWGKLYAKAEELFGEREVSLPTYTRPWIVPGEIIIRQSKTGAYIYKATLKVMLEQDYLKNVESQFKDQRLKELNDYSSALIRQFIIPRITQRVNASKAYAPLRQVYYSLILSQWFKQNFKDEASPYTNLIDCNNLTNLASRDPWSKTDYFNQYKKSFLKGEYNESEAIQTPYGQTIRQYTSGGIILKPSAGIVAIDTTAALPGISNSAFFTLKTGGGLITAENEAFSDMRDVPEGERTKNSDGGKLSDLQIHEKVKSEIASLGTDELMDSAVDSVLSGEDPQFIINKWETLIGLLKNSEYALMAWHNTPVRKLNSIETMGLKSNSTDLFGKKNVLFFHVLNFRSDEWINGNSRVLSQLAQELTGMNLGSFGHVDIGDQGVVLFPVTMLTGYKNGFLDAAPANFGRESLADYEGRMLPARESIITNMSIGEDNLKDMIADYKSVGIAMEQFLEILYMKAVWLERLIRLFETENIMRFNLEAGSSKVEDKSNDGGREHITLPADKVSTDPGMYDPLDLVNRSLWNLLVSTVWKSGYVPPKGRETIILNIACGPGDDFEVLSAFFGGRSFGESGSNVSITGVENDPSNMKPRRPGKIKEKRTIVQGDATDLSKLQGIPSQADVVVIRNQELYDLAAREFFKESPSLWLNILRQGMERLSPEGIIIVTSEDEDSHKFLEEAAESWGWRIEVNARNEDPDMNYGFDSYILIARRPIESGSIAQSPSNVRADNSGDNILQSGPFEAALRQRDLALTIAMNRYGEDNDESLVDADAVRFWKQKLDKIMMIGQYLQIQANGLIGYYKHFGTPFEERVGKSREDLINIIIEGKLRPAEGYSGRSGTLVNTRIDEKGILRDNSQEQAFVDTLITTMYGPYWIIMSPEVIGSDRAGGINSSYHEAYLVPEDLDRQFFSVMIDQAAASGRISSDRAEVFKKKIITYDEFIYRYNEALREGMLRHEAEAKEYAQMTKRIAKLKKEIEGLSVNDNKGAAGLIVDIMKDKTEPVIVRENIMRFTINDKFPVSIRDNPILLQAARDILKDPQESAEMKVNVIHFLYANSGESLSDVSLAETFLPFLAPDQDARIRIAVIEDVIKGSKDERMILSLVKTASDPDVVVRRKAVYQLTFNHPAVFEILNRYLHSADPQDQLVALYTLTRIKGEFPDGIIAQVNKVLTKSVRKDISLYAQRILDTQTSGARSEDIVLKDGGKGGIDFRNLPVSTQLSTMQPDLQVPIQPKIPLAELDKEWNNIQAMVNKGSIPSGEKIKGYVVSCCPKGDISADLEKVRSCISEIMRMEEDYALACEPGFIQLLSVLESNKSPQELQAALSAVLFGT